jgi:hypothetical protein
MVSFELFWMVLNHLSSPCILHVHIPTCILCIFVISLRYPGLLLGRLEPALGIFVRHSFSSANVHWPWLIS